jgi:hypothetical protein
MCVPGSELLEALLVMWVMGIVVLVRPGGARKAFDCVHWGQGTAWPPDDRGRTSCNARARGSAENAGGGHWEIRGVERVVWWCI